MRLLILGSGAVVTEFYLPALAWLGTEWTVTVADVSAAALERVRERAPWITTVQLGYEDAILTGDKFDAVVVALPNWLHVKACQLALRKKLPVLCEKPLALSKSECSELAELSREFKMPLEVAMVRRLTPANQAASQVLASGVIGGIKEIVLEHGSPYGWTSDSGAFFKKENGGILADLGVHQLDWISSVVGPLHPVSYVDDARGGVEADCEYHLRTADGIPITLKLSYRRLFVNNTAIVGERGTILIDRNDFEACRIVGSGFGDGLQVRPSRPFDDVTLPFQFESCFVQQLVDFSKVVEGKKNVRVSADDAASTIALIEYAYQSRPAGLNRVISGTQQELRPSLAPGKTIVTGGTGFIGGHLLERLAELGFNELTVPVRNYRTCVNAARFPVDLPRTDLTNPDAVQKMVAGARWVFHLAYGQTEKDATLITVDGTKTLIEESVRANVEAVVVLSTMGVFGHPNSESPVNESSPYAPAYGSYGKTKAAMEQWILHPEREFGRTRVIVLNPSCVYGPEGKTYTKMPYEFASRGEFAWVEGGRGIANVVFVDNLIDAILLVASDVRANRNRYLVNDDCCTWRQFLTPLLGGYANEIPNFTESQFHDLPKSKTVPSKTSDLLRHLIRDLGFLELVNRHRILGPAKSIALSIARKRLEKVRQSPLTQKTMNNAEQTSSPLSWLPEVFGPTSTRFSSDRLKSLGWQSRVSLEEGLKRSCEWLNRIGITGVR